MDSQWPDISDIFFSSKFYESPQTCESPTWEKQHTVQEKEYFTPQHAFLSPCEDHNSIICGGVNILEEDSSLVPIGGTKNDISDCDEEDEISREEFDKRTKYLWRKLMRDYNTRIREKDCKTAVEEIKFWDDLAIFWQMRIDKLKNTINSYRNHVTKVKKFNSSLKSITYIKPRKIGKSGVKKFSFGTWEFIGMYKEYRKYNGRMVDFTQDCGKEISISKGNFILLDSKSKDHTNFHKVLNTNGIKVYMEN